MFKKVILKKGEVFSKKYEGMIERPDGFLRLPRNQLLPNGKIRRVNQYFKIMFCAECKKETLKNKRNMITSNLSFCSSECLSKFRKKPDGWKKNKRGKDGDHVMIKQSNHPYADKWGFIPEHRFVIEKKIERFLLPEEQVHHINLIKNDNDPENLIIFKNASSHFLSHGTLNKCVAKLLKLGYLKFDRKNFTYIVEEKNEKNIRN